jgi:phosphatidylglycerol lysyltransferase
MLTISRHKIADFVRNFHWKEFLSLLFILIGIYFFRQQRQELKSLVPYIEKADQNWILAGLAVTVIYILLQAGMYVYSFSTAGAKLSWPASLRLFLRRNFISTFIPGGGVTTFAYLPSMLRKENLDRHKVFQGAGIQGFIGIFSVILVGLPVIFYAMFRHQDIKGATTTFVLVSLLLILAIVLLVAIRKKGTFYRTFIRIFPATENHIDELFSFNVSISDFTIATLFSIGIELSGILHLYISMRATGVTASWEAAFTGYIVSTLFLIVSPFLKGLGAVELSLAYILKLYGFTTLQALEITLLYRLFEFWIPLVAGLITWAWKGKNIFLRLLPPTLIFMLGAVNIFSVLTPPIASRVRMLRGYLPLESIHASNWMIILIGMILMVTAAFLIRGLRGAWWLAILFSFLSFIGHITKAFDYEEALLALSIIIILILTRKQYIQKSNARFIHIGIITSVSAFLLVLIFGAIGFYFLDKRNFGIDFSFQQSLKYAFNNFLLIREDDLAPVTRFGKEFIVSLKVLASGAWIFLFYTLLRPYINPTGTEVQANEKASYLLSQYGSSPVDYFKVDEDKLIYFSSAYEGFISYKIANGFSVVLEEPVSSEADKVPMLIEFEEYCRKMGLKSAYYRVDEDSLYHFEKLGKKKLLIGQEGIMNLRDFNLEGKQQKALRNTLNSLTKKGYTVHFHEAPIPENIVRELKIVSDEWLSSFNKTEMVFSQGMFDEKLISKNDIVVLYDSSEKPVAFLNIITDYAPDECTYDLIRKKDDAPGGSMDALLVKFALNRKEKGFSYLNLGMVPMSGITEPENAAERVVKYAYEKIKRFKHYQGLRDFKEKYATIWLNKYLVYENDFDLVQLPRALNKVMQPAKVVN